MQQLQIYKITNQVNSKIYIGLTVQGWEKRVKRHFADAANGCEFKLHRAIRKYGSEHFEATLLETCKSFEHLKEREKFWIKVIDTTNDSKGYNMTLGGDGTLGRKHSIETREKISKKAKSLISSRHVPIQMKNLAGEICMIDSIRDAAIILEVPEETLRHALVKGKGSAWIKDIIVTRRDDLKSMPKPKKLGRDKKQVKEHMKMMQIKSAEARKTNSVSYSEKQRNAKADKVKPIYQFDLEGNLVKKHLGAREAAKVSGVSRGGIRNCIRNKTYICKESIWSLTNDEGFINEIINNK